MDDQGRQVADVPTAARRFVEAKQHWPTAKIHYLINWNTNRIVYIDSEFDLEWKADDAFFEKIDKNSFLKIQVAAANIESIPCEWLDEANKIRFKRLIGEALVCALDGGFEQANSGLVDAAKFIRDRSEEKSRLWYLGSSFMFATILLAIGLGIWVFRSTYVALLGEKLLWIAMAASAGAGGALISIIQRSSKLQFDCSSGKRLHFLEAGSRVFTGAFSGLITCVGMQAELILTAVAHGPAPHPAMIFAGFAAGAGERLIGSIIASARSLETKPTNSPPLSTSGERGP